MKHGGGMPRQSNSDKLATLRKQQKELAEKLREAEVKAKAEEKEREDKKALVAGRAFLRELAENQFGPAAAELTRVVDKWTPKAADRALFGLPPLPKSGEAAPQAAGGSEVGNA